MPMRNQFLGRDLRFPRLGAMRAGGGGGGAMTVEGLRYGATPNGRTSTATLKVVGVDAMPSGMTLSGRTITVSTPQLIISDWDFTGYTLSAEAFVWSVSQCLFGDGDRTDLVYFITGNSAGTIRQLQYCTFTGRGDHQGAGTAVNSAVSGTGASVTAFEVDYIHHCRFVDLTSDSIKTAGSSYWNGQRVEWCYFGPPRNLPNTPTVWDSVTTYAAGYCVTDPGTGWYYVSKSDGNLNNALPPGVSKTEENTFWLGVDPHADAITTVASIGRTSVRNCLFDWTDDPPGAAGPYGNQAGVNNWARVSRNTGTDYLLDQVMFEDCVAYYGPFSSSPIQVLDNGLANWNGPIIFRNVTTQPNSGGVYFHPSTNGAVDYWINTSGTAPTGAITTDAAAAPSWSTSPTLTGTAASGATLTATVGSAAGFPAPFYDLAIQRSDDGSTGWADYATDTATLTLVAGDVGKYFRARVRAFNSSGEAYEVSSVLGPVAAGYTLNRVNTNGTGSLGITPGGTANAVTFSAWVSMTSLTVPSAPRFIRASLGIDIYAGSGGQIIFAVWNSAGTAIYNAQSATGILTAGVQAHVFASYDGATGTPFVAVNGVTITMTPTVGPLTGALRPNRSHEILRTGTSIAQAIVGDYWLEYGASVRSVSTFWNGGTPPNLTGVGAPQLWLGGSMVAAGWNAGTNNGSGTVVVTSGTFTDA